MLDLCITSLGLLIVILAILDMLSATFGTSGGFMARRLSMLVWAMAIRVFELLNRRQERTALRIMGTSVAMLLLIFWVGCVILGWMMVFSYDGAIEHQGEKNFTDWMDYLQFSVSTLSGLGRGLWKSSAEPFWEGATLVAALIGTFVISFAISFLIPIIQAAKEKRVVAHTISSLASTPIELLNSYARDDASAFDEQLRALSSSLTSCYQAHRSYPALHFMHSDEAFDALGLNLVVLDEALTLMKYAVPELYEPPPSIYDPTRELLSRFFAELEHVYMLKWQGERLVDMEDLALLEGLELEQIDREGYVRAARSEELRERRRATGTLLRNSGWSWADVYPNLELSQTKPLEMDMSTLVSHDHAHSPAQGGADL